MITCAVYQCSTVIITCFTACLNTLEANVHTYVLYMYMCNSYDYTCVFNYTCLHVHLYMYMYVCANKFRLFRMNSQKSFCYWNENLTSQKITRYTVIFPKILASLAQVYCTVYIHAHVHVALALW